MNPATAKSTKGSRRARKAGPSEGAVLRTKLQPPTPRRELVARPALVERLVEDGDHRLTLFSAPAGSGKTTLLVAWHTSPREQRPFAWLSLDRWDNDPVRFWLHVVAALRTVAPAVGHRAFALLSAPHTSVLEDVLPALINELEPLEEPFVLVLDDYHAIENPEIDEALAFLVERLPPSLHLVLATRSDPALPLARLRVGGELLEIRAADLRFQPDESAEFLNGLLALELSPQDVMLLHSRTEGWVAGLYLAALSLRGRRDPRPFIAAFAGDDRHLVDYLGSEVLANQPHEVRAFMLRTSVLERLSGSLCDAVTEMGGSTEMLRAIEQANLFLIPLDARRRWYRYHHLFGGLLLHELRRTDPDLVPKLHRRAARWYEAAGSPPEAIHHAIAAGDVDGAVELIAGAWNTFFNQGRLATVSGWLDALPADAVARDSRLAIARAWLALDFGRLAEVDLWIEAAESAGLAMANDDGVALELAVVRSVHRFKIGDIGGAQQAALDTLELAPEGALFPRTVAQCILGITLYWSGEPGRALGALEEAASLAEADGNRLGVSYALGYLSVILSQEGEPEAEDDLAARAIALGEDLGFTEHFVMMMAHLGRGRSLERSGGLAAAEATFARALELGRRGAGRIEVAAALASLAEARHARSAGKEARALLAEARRVLAQCPDPRSLTEAVESAEQLLSARRRRSEQVAREELTDRELAVLRLLDTELSRREIGAALYVSLNTVKSHMRAILRKLGVSNRDEAVARARARGLI